MSRRLLAALVLSWTFVGCGQGPPSEWQKLDRRIRDPVRIPTSDEWRRVPNFRIQADSVEVVTLSIPSGRKVSTAADLRRLLVSLPRTDWPYGRQALCHFPSIIFPGEAPVPASSRWVFDVLKELDISYVAVA